MLALENLSLRHKQMLIITLTSSIVLLLACAVFVICDTVTLRQQLVARESSVAEVIGNTVVTAVEANDRKTAESTLSALRSEPNISSACIYNSAGKVLAAYQRDNRGRVLGFPSSRVAGHEFIGNQLRVFLAIKQRDAVVGSIFVSSDVNGLSTQLAHRVGVMTLVFIAGLLIAFVLSDRWQRIVSNPIMQLAQAARSATVDKNYSMRVPKQGSNELGQLIDGFNTMLNQLQQRDSDVRATREGLDLLRVLLDNSTDYIYFKDAQSRFIKTSKAHARLFGMTSSDGLVGKTDFDFFAEAHARPAFEDEQNIIRTGQPIIGKTEMESWKDGRPDSWVLSTKMPLRNKAGVIIGTFGISKDITALKETEAELSYERDLLKALLDSSPDSIYFKDVQSRFVRLSKSKLEKGLAVCLEQHRNTSGKQDLPVHLTSLEEFSKYAVGKTDFDFLPDKIARQAFDEEQEIIRTGTPIIGKLEKYTTLDGKAVWALSSKMLWRGKDGETLGTFGTTKDITSIKEAEAKVDAAQKQLLEISRQAGMAEVATSVLHNVGNVLNSVNVSAALVADNARQSTVSYVGKVAALMAEHAKDLGSFMTKDPKGRELPGFLTQLSGQLAKEQQDAIKELDLLRQNIEHIKDIVAMQQSYAQISGVTETIMVTDLVEDALRLNAGALVRHEVELVREYGETPPVSVEKHKVLQILVNLIRNAKYACDEAGRKDKQLTLKVSPADNGVQIAVIDNGVGIPADNLARVFNHGFTTRKKGHGFGLHSSLMTAREMGGSLTVLSDGAGRGASFILTLPLQPPKS